MIPFCGGEPGGGNIRQGVFQLLEAVRFNEEGRVKEGLAVKGSSRTKASPPAHVSVEEAEVSEEVLFNWQRQPRVVLSHVGGVVERIHSISD